MGSKFKMTNEPTAEPTVEGGSAPFASLTRSSRRRWWQFGLRTTILVVAIAAVAMTVVNDRRRIPVLKDRIAALKPLARELSIDDPSQVAVVKLDELWYDENQWDVYLSPASAYRFCIATRAIDLDGMSPSSHATPLAGGRHLIAFERTQDDSKAWHLVVTFDGKPALKVDEPADWDWGVGWGDSGFPGVSRQLPLDRPVELFRRRFMVTTGDGSSTTPDGPCPGVLLWIEREPAAVPR